MDWRTKPEADAWIRAATDPGGYCCDSGMTPAPEAIDLHSLLPGLELILLRSIYYDLDRHHDFAKQLLLIK